MRLAGMCGGTIGCLFPSPLSRTGSRPGEKKAASGIDTEYVDWALDNFSGYIAADELYDGPYCVLSIVDNHTFKRIAYQVLDHNPTHDDIRAFFQRFQAALQQRGLQLRGITTDGSPLYPVPLADVFGDVPHQICEFHVLKELTKAVLRAVAKVRKALAAEQPKVGRGRSGGVRGGSGLREPVQCGTELGGGLHDGHAVRNGVSERSEPGSLLYGGSGVRGLCGRRERGRPVHDGASVCGCVRGRNERGSDLCGRCGLLGGLSGWRDCGGSLSRSTRLPGRLRRGTECRVGLYGQFRVRCRGTLPRRGDVLYRGSGLCRGWGGSVQPERSGCVRDGSGLWEPVQCGRESGGVLHR